MAVEPAGCGSESWPRRAADENHIGARAAEMHQSLRGRHTAREAVSDDHRCRGERLGAPRDAYGAGVGEAHCRETASRQAQAGNIHAEKIGTRETSACEVRAR